MLYVYRRCTVRLQCGSTKLMEIYDIRRFGPIAEFEFCLELPVRFSSFDYLCVFLCLVSHCSLFYCVCSFQTQNCEFGSTVRDVRQITLCLRKPRAAQYQFIQSSIVLLPYEQKKWPVSFEIMRELLEKNASRNLQTDLQSQ